MLIQRVTCLQGGIEWLGLEYNFIDTVIDKYSSQDNLQVMVVMELKIKLIKPKFPGIKEISFGSDNTSSFAFHDNIPFSTVSIRKTWRLVESIFGFLAGSTWKHVLEKNLDTHFSFVNIQPQSFVLSGNDITERQILRHSVTKNMALLARLQLFWMAAN
jgi:hypothetical protein